jgi:hypothetical protein
MAMYNYPHLAPPLPSASTLSPAADPSTDPIPAAHNNTSNAISIQATVSNALLASSAEAGSRNPFSNSDKGALVNGNGNGGGGGKHATKESVDFRAGAMDANAGNGRHSPDAFTSLSARFMRMGS